MSVSWGAKDPHEVRSYRYSWLGRLNGAEIVTAAIQVASGSITLSDTANTTDAVSATISGGISGEQAIITSTVVTTDGETLEETFILEVEEGALSSAGPSTSTKRQLIEMAYEECSLSGYEFDVTPEEIFTGLRKLDALMAEWRASSKDVGYNAPAIFGDGDLDDYSGVPDAAINAVTISLAMALAPQMGKVMSAESRQRLASSMNVVRAMCARTRDVSWARGVPAGAGNRRYNRSPFMPVARR